MVSTAGFMELSVAHRETSSLSPNESECSGQGVILGVIDHYLTFCEAVCLFGKQTSLYAPLLDSFKLCF